MEDAKIVELFWERKECAIQAASDKYNSFCFRIAYKILYSREDSEECVNDTWLGAWKSMPPQRPERLSTYLGKITRNLSINRFKKYTAEKRGLGQTVLVLSELEDCIPDQANVEQMIDEQILVKAINDFLYAQPEQKRNIFIRRYWHLFSIKDIAVAYGMSESKVASLLFRMRNDLKTYFEKEGINL